MKRKYLALLLAAVTAVTQISGATTFAMASDLIVEPEAVETVAEELVTQKLDEADAAVEEEESAGAVSAGDLTEMQDDTSGEEEFAEIEDADLDADWGDDTDNLQDLDADDGEKEPAEEGTAGEDAVSAEEGQANFYDAAELNLDSSDFLEAVDLADTQEVEALNLSEDEEAAAQNDEPQDNLGPQIELEWSNGNDWMRPGESQEVTVEAWYEKQDAEGNYYRDKSHRILLNWNYSDDYITVEESKDSEWRDDNTIIKTFKVTVKDDALLNSDDIPKTDESGNVIDKLDVDITFEICPVKEDWKTEIKDENDETLWYKKRTETIHISNGYSNLLPISIDQMAVGEEKKITAALTDCYLDENGNLQQSTRDKVRYAWNWDPEQMKIWYKDENNEEIVLDPNENNSIVSKNSTDEESAEGSGVTFHLQKLTNDDTKIELYTQVMDENGQWQDDWYRDYGFGSTDYVYGIKEEIENDSDLKIFPSDQLTLTAAIRDEVAEFENWDIEWKVGLYDSDDVLDNDEWNAYSVSGDRNEKITLNGAVIQEALGLQENQWFGVWAYVKVTLDKNEESFNVDQYDCGIQFLKESYELYNLLWENMDVLHGWEDWMSCDTEAWAKNAQYPNGKDRPAKITNVVVENSENSENSSESASVSCEKGTNEEGEEGYWLKVVDYGTSKVTVTYQIAMEDNESGEPAYIGEYSYEYYINVCGDRYDIRLTSDRDINGYTNLQPGDSVTLYAEVNPAYENDIDPEIPPVIKVVWNIEESEEEPGENAKYINLEPSEDGTECKVTVKENIENRDIKVIAKVMVQWDGDPEPYERASADWGINVNSQYFQITLDNSGNHYDYSLEDGEQIKVTPTLKGVGGDLEVPDDIEWRWEYWDPNRLAIRDSSEEEISANSEEETDNSVTGKELTPDDNTGIAPFTLTKLGKEQTSIRLVAYSDGEQLAELWMDFAYQNYGIWYEDLLDQYGTWFYLNDAYNNEEPAIQLNTSNLKDKDKYQIEWYLGTFDDDGEPIDGQMIEAGNDKGYTVSEDGSFAALNLSYLREWLENNDRGSFTVQARVLAPDSSEGEVPEVLEQTNHIDVEVRGTVCDYDFGLGIDDDGIFRPSTDDGRRTYPEINVYVENSQYPYGKTLQTTVTDVKLEIDEECPQKAILLDFNEDEEGVESWEYTFLNQCTGTITIQYKDVLSGKDTSIEIPVEVQNEGYYFEFDQMDDCYLHPSETMQIQARVAHWQQNQAWISDDKNVTVRWEITDQKDANGNDVDENNPIVKLSVPTADNPENDEQSAASHTDDRARVVTALREGEANICLTAYAADDENEWQVAEANIWVCVNNLKIVDENGTAMEQYADYGQQVALSLKLQQSGDETNSDYTGAVRYIWEFNEDNVDVSLLEEKDTIKVSQEDGRTVMTVSPVDNDSDTSAEQEDADDGQGGSETTDTMKAQTLDVALMRSADSWGSARVTAQIQNGDKEWQDAASREWYFNEYGKNIWPKDARGDYYTWLYSDETDYKLTMNVDEGMLANGRWMEWTIGIAEGADENRRVIATYPQIEKVAGEVAALDGDNTELTNEERVNWTTDGTTLTIKRGEDLGEWIVEQRAIWSENHGGESSYDKLELFIEATVKMDILDEEADSEEGDAEKALSDFDVPSEPEEGYERVDVSSCRIGFGVRTPYEYWEDSDTENLLLGQGGLYYDYNENYDCVTISREVYDAEHPWGDTEYYELLSIESSNENALKVETVYDDGDTSKAVRYNIIPLSAGEAEITYTIRAIGEDDAKPFKKEYTKYVIGSDYVGGITLSGDSDYLKEGESRRLRLIVKQRQSIQNEDGTWDVKMTAVPENQYTVQYVDQTDGKLEIKGDMVTVLNASDGWGGVEAIVTIPQSEGDPYELYVTTEFSLENDWYAFDTVDNYEAKPDRTLTITPKIYHYYENGTKSELWTMDNLNVEENWTEGGVNIAVENGTLTVISEGCIETSATFRLSATIIDEYGYEREVEDWFWVTFCNHEHKDADGWQIVYWSTCSEEGLKEQWCSKCGWIMKTESIEKLAHTWDAGKTTKYPTCTAEGETTYTCEKCPATKTEPIAKAEHTAGSWTTEKAATCTATGKEVQKCTVCGTTVNSRTTSAKGHKAGNWQTEKAATCTATGKEVQKCTVCGTTVNSKTTPAKDHSWSSYTVTKQPTAVTEGTETRTCTSCKKTENRSIAKLTPTIKLTENKLTIQVNKTASLKSLVTNLAAGDAIASWKSSNTKIVTVDKNGKIKGVKAGKKADITVTLKSGLSAKLTVTVQKKAVATSEIQIEKTSITLKKGEKTTLTPIVTPITTKDKVTYKTSDKKVATVNSKGQVEAKKSGTATITITSGKKSVKVKVTVKAVQPTKITGIPTSKTLKKGKSLTLKPKLSPKGSEAVIKYSSSNKKIAAVNSKGKITAKKKGTAVITVTAGKVKVSCTITVR